MTDKEYRQHPAISRSELWRISESPEKFRYYKDNPTEPTPALLFGQMVHKIVLEPDDWETDFAILPDIDRRTKDGKAAYNAFFADVGERSVVTRSDYEKAVCMARVLYSNPLAAKLLDGQHETPLFWNDPDTGEDCKCRLDNSGVLNSKAFLSDYKSCTDASNRAFERDAEKWGYAFQAAMYMEGFCRNEYGVSALDLITNETNPPFVFIVQEKEPPYSVNIFLADKAFLLKGFDRFREYMGIYHHCNETDNWYGYLGEDNIINTLSLPAWMKGENE